ncbi:uncharacterized protein LOC135378777 [Ornithodoros turicata]|uniref:uncharacterized protein LOC135378777 n=1 Tax=Ornithodoros turicata TaxID=34597 RepID=UPI0031386B41
MDDSPEAHPFFIVKFPDEENMVAVVPSNWMAGDDRCYWPPSKDEKKASLYIRKRKTPTYGWQNLPCIKVAEYETYSEAREMLPLAEKTSDLNAEDEYGRGKRKRIIVSNSDDSSPPVSPLMRKAKRPVKNRSFSQPTAHTLDDDSIFVGPNIERSFRHSASDYAPSATERHFGSFRHSASDYAPSVPWPSATERHLESFQHSASDYAHSVPSVSVPSPSATETHLALPSRTSYWPGNCYETSAPLLQRNTQQTRHNEEGIEPSITTAEGQQKQSKKPVNLASIQLNSAFEKKVLRSLNLIQLRLSEHSEQLDSISTSLQQREESSEGRVVIRQFPDLESFVNFSEELKQSPEKKEMLRKYMASLGGNNLGDRVRRILYHLIPDEVSVCFNWTGTGGKRKFKTLEFTNVMLGVITSPPSTSTAAEVEKVVQTWLRHGQERLQKKAAKLPVDLE